MRKLLQENRIFLIAYMAILFFVLALKFFYTKEELFLNINEVHSNWADFIFPFITYLGDGVMVLLICVLFLFVKFRYSLQLLIIYLISSQITQILKRFVFNDFQRPSKYFEGIADLHFVEGVELNKMMSFPSGHTTSVFALMAFLSLISKNKNYSLLFLTLACIAAFSRIYLAQHFLEDTIAGSVIGVFTAFAISVWLSKYNWFNSDKLSKSFLRK